MKSIILSVALFATSIAFAQIPTKNAYLDYKEIEPNSGFYTDADKELIYSTQEGFYIRSYNHTSVGIANAHRQFFKDIQGARYVNKGYMPDFVDADDYYMIELVTEQETGSILYEAQVGLCTVYLHVGEDNCTIAYLYK